MVNTVKFSQFSNVNLNTSTNQLVGVSSPLGGINFKSSITTSWTTLGRPSSPYDGLLGYNTDTKLYEYWNSTTSTWKQLATI